MSQSSKRHVGRSLMLALVGLVTAGPLTLVAQEQAEECELEGSAAVNRAVESLQEAAAETDPALAEAAYREAYAALESEIADNKTTAQILGAQAQIGLEDYESALDLIMRFEEARPECKGSEAARNTRYNGWVGLYNAGIQAYNTNDMQAALAAFDMANSFYRDSRSLFNAGILYRQEGDNAKAIEAFRGALETEGGAEDLRGALTSLAELLAAEGDLGGAVEAYEGFLARFPDDVVGRIRYALALMDAGDEAQATEIFTAVLQRDDLTMSQWVEVGVGLYNSDQYSAAAEAFSKARVGNPYSKEAMENLVSASVQANQAGPVVSLADSLVTWYPYDRAEYERLASALAKIGNDERALSVMQDSQTLPMIFHSSQMAEMGSGVYRVRGVVEGAEAGAGKTVTIAFEFLDADGQVLATEELSLQVPAAGATSSFQIDVASGVPIAGFRYSKASDI